MLNAGQENGKNLLFVVSHASSIYWEYKTTFKHLIHYSYMIQKCKLITLNKESKQIMPRPKKNIAYIQSAPTLFKVIGKDNPFVNTKNNLSFQNMVYVL